MPEGKGKQEITIGFGYGSDANTQYPHIKIYNHTEEVEQSLNSFECLKKPDFLQINAAQHGAFEQLLGEGWSLIEKKGQQNNEFTLYSIFKLLENKYQIKFHQNAKKEFEELIKKNNSVKSQISTADLNTADLNTADIDYYSSELHAAQEAAAPFIGFEELQISIENLQRQVVDAGALSPARTPVPNPQSESDSALGATAKILQPFFKNSDNSNQDITPLTNAINHLRSLSLTDIDLSANGLTTLLNNEVFKQRIKQNILDKNIADISINAGILQNEIIRYNDITNEVDFISRPTIDLALQDLLPQANSNIITARTIALNELARSQDSKSDSPIAQNRQKTIEDFINNTASTKLFIPIQNGHNHFTLLYVKKTEADNSKIDIVYIDPTATPQGLSQEKQQQIPLTNGVPTIIMNSLFKNKEDIINSTATTNNQIQTLEQDPQSALTTFTNNHCGPFVIFLANALAKDQLKIEPRAGNTTSTILKNNKAVINLSKEQSDHLGKTIRQQLLNNNSLQEENLLTQLPVNEQKQQQEPQTKQPEVKQDQKQTITQEVKDQLKTACYTGSINKIEELIAQYSANILKEKLDTNGNNALLLAAYHGQNNTIDHLLSKGLSLDFTNNYGNNALLNAAYGGQNNTIDHLLSKGLSLDFTNNYGSNALLRAALNGQNNTIDHLLSKGLSLYFTNNYGDNALLRAAYHGQNNTIDHLLNKGLSLDFTNNISNNALLRAAYSGHISTIKKLIELGIDINIKGNNNKTAREWACEYYYKSDKETVKKEIIALIDNAINIREEYLKEEKTKQQEVKQYQKQAELAKQEELKKQQELELKFPLSTTQPVRERTPIPASSPRVETSIDVNSQINNPLYIFQADNIEGMGTDVISQKFQKLIIIDNDKDGKDKETVEKLNGSSLTSEFSKKFNIKPGQKKIVDEDVFNNILNVKTESQALKREEVIRGGSDSKIEPDTVSDNINIADHVEFYADFDGEPFKVYLLNPQSHITFHDVITGTETKCSVEFKYDARYQEGGGSKGSFKINIDPKGQEEAVKRAINERFKQEFGNKELFNTQGKVNTDILNFHCGRPPRELTKGEMKGSDITIDLPSNTPTKPISDTSDKDLDVQL